MEATRMVTCLSGNWKPAGRFSFQDVRSRRDGFGYPAGMSFVETVP